MAKSEKKEHKKRKERGENAGDTTVGDTSMAVSEVQERVRSHPFPFVLISSRIRTLASKKEQKGEGRSCH